MLRFSLVTLSVLALLVSISSNAHAVANPNRDSNDWKFALTPLFLWGVSIEGKSAIGPQEAPLDLEFTDEIFRICLQSSQFILKPTEMTSVFLPSTSISTSLRQQPYAVGPPLRLNSSPILVK